ncbi:hypothetical protein E2C01_019023 [Portunus trituberculatus]|uniref:Uncharacterized protein n=1 Tax=Portunus trituberculatus TaxID=210409 RepID=A0A5B7DXR9_PORTR|nr:hypothetical protein [Portunus trituberculatus]
MVLSKAFPFYSHHQGFDPPGQQKSQVLLCLQGFTPKTPNENCPTLYFRKHEAGGLPVRRAQSLCELSVSLASAEACVVGLVECTVRPSIRRNQTNNRLANNAGGKRHLGNIHSLVGTQTLASKTIESKLGCWLTVPDSEEGRWADLRKAGLGGSRRVGGMRGPGGRPSWQTGRHLGAGVDISRPVQLPQSC